MFGQLLSIPFIFLFFASWVASSLFRPLVYISAVCLVANPLQTARKARLFGLSLLYITFCNDKTWKQPKEDPQSFFGEANGSSQVGSKKATKVEKKTIIFVRHGESTWNDTFNRGGRSKLKFILLFIPNLIWAVCVELYLFVSGKCNESWFFDSPLSYKGVRQASDLRTFLQSTQHTTAAEKEILDLMTGITKVRSMNGSNGGNGKGTPASQMVSSNLRRSISTMALGFQDRLDKKLPDDSIIILSQLQEISRNPDALSITPPKGKMIPSWIDRGITHCDFGRIFHTQVDTSLNQGNKPINSNGLKRMNEFCTVAFSQIRKETIIVGGHSLWFRSFFRTFLPHDFDHIAKKKKLINGACAAFTLLKMTSDGEDNYMIDPKSIHVIYGGF